jgi:DNA-binding response OmpR family regulator
LLLTDVVMPGRDGRSLYEALRAERSELRVLFVSDYPDERLSPRGVLDTGFELLQRPFNVRELLVRVRQTLIGIQ